MKAVPRPRAFPWSRLARFAQADVSRLAQWSPDEALALAGAMAGTPAPESDPSSLVVRLERVQRIPIEDLRRSFPGHWTFWVLVDTLAERQAFVAFDPCLLASISRPEDAQEFLLRCLETLSDQKAGWDGWRWQGSLRSTGELGRQILEEDGVLAAFVRIKVGCKEGYLVWLESERSTGRKKGTRAIPLDFRPWFSLTLPWSRVMGWTRLRLAELEALACGDILLFEKEPPESLVCLSRESLHLWGDAAGQAHMTLNHFQRLEACMPNEKSLVVSENTTPLLSDEDRNQLSIPLVVEAGRVSLTLGELLGLRKGDVLTLPLALLAPVEVRCSERLIARGELVEIEGRRGVRLIELPQPGGSHDSAAA